MVRISDENIIELLQKNGRTPAAHIAAKLGVTETAVRKRIKKLEDNGTITQYTIRTSPKKTGQTHVFIGVDSEPEHFMSTVKYCREQTTVTRAYTTSGDHTIQLECAFPDNDAFTNFIDELEARPGVKRVCPGIITDTIK